MNGYRQYDQNCIDRVKFIFHAKEVGLSLSDIEELLSIKIEAEQHTCQEVKNITEAKLRDIEQRIIQLQHIHDALQMISERCRSGSHLVKDLCKTFNSILLCFVRSGNCWLENIEKKDEKTRTL
ncbi:MerR family DNA-binding protein [Vibrio sp. JC009]|uniref:MerR family DNA-binding protein n=1 Tax=Vibrio sp. JC009 TaxID=2912314 RepID=UPI0023B0F63A|nr:MerR family DNA-binding protein [Vibrio sp. JC009]WED24686.1 MerR family DNA-binding protein [Vibrio sp. JC009]